LKTADEIVDEIALAVRPPCRIAIVLTESPGDAPNWMPAASPMDLAQTQAFAAKVVALRESDPQVDWSSATERHGKPRRVAKWLSEVPE
jgi:hypothetical protein